MEIFVLMWIRKGFFQPMLIGYFTQVNEKKMIAQNSFEKEMAGPIR